MTSEMIAEMTAEMRAEIIGGRERESWLESIEP